MFDLYLFLVCCCGLYLCSGVIFLVGKCKIEASLLIIAKHGKELWGAVAETNLRSCDN